MAKHSLLSALNASDSCKFSEGFGMVATVPRFYAANERSGEEGMGGGEEKAAGKMLLFSTPVVIARPWFYFFLLSIPLYIKALDPPKNYIW